MASEAADLSAGDGAPLEAQAALWLGDEERRADVLEAADEREAAAIQLWLACRDAAGEGDGRKRAHFARSIADTFLAPGAPGARALPAPVVADFGAALAAAQGRALDPAVFAPLARAAVAFVLGSGVVERRTATPAKIRSARDWVLGPEKGSVDTEKELTRLRAARARIQPELASGRDASTQELHSWIKVLLPMLIVYGEEVEGELDVIFERLGKVDPLSAVMLRRKAVMVSFVRNHKRELPSDRLAKMIKTLSSFSFESPEEQTRKFNNAVEAFAQGRNHNKHVKSAADLRDVIHGLNLFDPLKQVDPVLRKNLLDAEHAFEAALVLQPSNHKLLWNWALHYWWTASTCEHKRPEATGRFLLAAAAKCQEALALRSSHYKPLLLWSEIVYRIATHPGYGVQQEAFSSSMDEYTKAMERYCARRPFDFDLEPLRKLALVESPLQGEMRRLVARCLRNLAANGAARKLCLTAADMWLTLEQSKALESESMRKLLTSVGITLAEAHAHLESFVAVIHGEFAKKARRHAGAAVDSTVADGDHLHSKRKESMWVPDQSKQVEAALKLEDPRKHYYFNAVIGSGAFGTVSVGRRRSDKCPVAIKEQKRGLSQCRDEVLSEIGVLQMCRNKNIVHFMDAFAHKDRVYIVMLYCDGGSLDAVIRKMELKEHVISHIFRAVCSGLDYLERICLVHRDLKPGNILLSRNGDIRIGDLGLVKQQVQCQFKHSRAGTPLFRAPEVLLGHGATTKSDMYSFGCSVYNAHYGEPPRAHLSPSKVMYFTTTEEGVPEFRSLDKSRERSSKLPSKQLMEVMERCFALDPVKRAAAFEVLKMPFFFDQNVPTVRQEISEICDMTFLDNALETFGL